MHLLPSAAAVAPVRLALDNMEVGMVGGWVGVRAGGGWGGGGGGGGGWGWWRCGAVVAGGWAREKKARAGARTPS